GQFVLLNPPFGDDKLAQRQADRIVEIFFAQDEVLELGAVAIVRGGETLVPVTQTHPHLARGAGVIELEIECGIAGQIQSLGILSQRDGETADQPLVYRLAHATPLIPALVKKLEACLAALRVVFFKQKTAYELFT